MVTPPPIELANLGMADSLILMVMALVVFGPRRLPQIGRQIGKLMYEFRKASNDFKFQMEEELRSAEDAERQKKQEENYRSLSTPVSEQATVSTEPPSAVANSIETPLASPYPGEGQYPPQYPPESTAAAPPIEVTTAPVEPTQPRIMPPSTGETVAASWPARLASLQSSEPAASETAPSAQSVAQADGTTADIAPKPQPGAAEALKHG